MTQPGYSSPATGASNLGAQPRRFGFGTGLFAGLVGAGVLGMLFGHGFFGGLGGIGSILGLLLQIGLIVLVVRFALNWFRNRQQPAYVGAPSGGSGYARDGSGPQGGGLGGMAGGLGGLGAAMGFGGGRPSEGTPLEIGQADYTAFERLLGEVQDAYAREDLDALRRVTTPEMVSFMAEDLADNARKGLVNELKDVKFVQGDLAEAWREDGADYATVAMRFSLIDIIRERATGRIVSGDLTRPETATEIWTFRRPAGGAWMLAAIQQAQ
jgi:predicted lipid-binding transport protein (Tim44 family)